MTSSTIRLMRSAVSRPQTRWIQSLKGAENENDPDVVVEEDVHQDDESGRPSSHLVSAVEAVVQRLYHHKCWYVPPIDEHDAEHAEVSQQPQTNARIAPSKSKTSPICMLRFYRHLPSLEFCILDVELHFRRQIVQSDSAQHSNSVYHGLPRFGPACTPGGV